MQLNSVAATSIFSCTSAVMSWSLSWLWLVTSRDTMTLWSTTTLPGLRRNVTVPIRASLFFPRDDPKIPVPAAPALT